jgi:rubrerythrin
MNRWGTETVTCPVCGWGYTLYGTEPTTCPACERAKSQAELDRVLAEAKK